MACPPPSPGAGGPDLSCLPQGVFVVNEGGTSYYYAQLCDATDTPFIRCYEFCDGVFNELENYDLQGNLYVPTEPAAPCDQGGLDFEPQCFTDDSGTQFWGVFELENGQLVMNFFSVDQNGNVTPYNPTSNPVPCAPNDVETDSKCWMAIADGVGYTTGDQLTQWFFWDVTTNPATLTGTVWYNQNTGLVLAAAPPMVDVEECQDCCPDCEILCDVIDPDGVGTPFRRCYDTTPPTDTDLDGNPYVVQGQAGICQVGVGDPSINYRVLSSECQQDQANTVDKWTVTSLGEFTDGVLTDTQTYYTNRQDGTIDTDPPIGIVLEPCPESDPEITNTSQCLTATANGVDYSVNDEISHIRFFDAGVQISELFINQTTGLTLPDDSVLADSVPCIQEDKKTTSWNRDLCDTELTLSFFRVFVQGIENVLMDGTVLQTWNAPTGDVTTGVMFQQNGLLYIYNESSKELWSLEPDNFAAGHTVVGPLTLPAATSSGASVNPITGDVWVARFSGQVRSFNVNNLPVVNVHPSFTGPGAGTPVDLFHDPEGNIAQTFDVGAFQEIWTFDTATGAGTLAGTLPTASQIHYTEWNDNAQVFYSILLNGITYSYDDITGANFQTIGALVGGGGGAAALVDVALAEEVKFTRCFTKDLDTNAVTYVDVHPVTGQPYEVLGNVQLCDANGVTSATQVRRNWNVEGANWVAAAELPPNSRLIELSYSVIVGGADVSVTDGDGVVTNNLPTGWNDSARAEDGDELAGAQAISPGAGGRVIVSAIWQA